jgi:hypothetical protein
MEKEGPDEVEVAEEANEEGKTQEGQAVGLEG